MEPKLRVFSKVSYHPVDNVESKLYRAIRISATLKVIFIHRPPTSTSTLGMASFSTGITASRFAHQLDRLFSPENMRFTLVSQSTIKNAEKA